MDYKGKEFVVSVADFAFYLDGVLACTGTTNLSSTLSVSMQEQAVNAGKGNQKVFSFKYGRELTAELEAADWRLEYIAMQTGSKISVGLNDIYHIAECVTLVNGVGTLADTPITGTKVGIQLPNGTFIEVTPTGKTFNLTGHGLTTEMVRCTYRYNATVKRITIDSETSPMVGRLVLQADKHNSKKGKVGTLEIVIPSYSLDGNFDISFTPDGVVSTTMAGTALSVEGDSCEDGSAVYAYISEKDDDTIQGSQISEIALSAPASSVRIGSSLDLTTVGIISAMYKPIELGVEDVVYSTDPSAKATVTDGKLTGVAAGVVTVTASYTVGSLTLTDTLQINVVAA